MKSHASAIFIFFCFSFLDGALCAEGLWCSQFGWCGSTTDYRGPTCKSQCRSGAASLPPRPSWGIDSLIGRSLFEKILKHRNDAVCKGKGFYSYMAFIAAAKSFPQFASVGGTTTRKRELAAFLAQTSNETTGGWLTAPDGPYAWGYCFVQEQGDPSDYCVNITHWPCVPGRKYYGRGPIQISYNYNYGPAGKAIGDGPHSLPIMRRSESQDMESSPTSSMAALSAAMASTIKQPIGLASIRDTVTYLE